MCVDGRCCNVAEGVEVCNVDVVERKVVSKDQKQKATADEYL